MDMKRFFLYFIVVAALALAGCGGGGGGGMADMTDPGTPDEPGVMPPTEPDPPRVSDCTLGGGIELDCTGTVQVKGKDVNVVQAAFDADPPESDGVTANRDEVKILMHGEYGDQDKEAKLLTSDEIQMLSGNIPATLGDFNLRVGTLTKEAKGSVSMVEDVVTYYTNQDAKGDAAYTKFFAPKSDGSGMVEDVPGVSMVEVDTDDDTKVGGDGILTLNIVTVKSGAKLESDFFPSGGSQDFSYNSDFADANNDGIDDDTNGPDLDKDGVGDGDDILYDGPNKFRGAFYGIPGEFKCIDSADCTASTNSKGELKSLVGDWTFEPDDTPGSITVEGVIMDEDFLSFGYWVQKTTDADNGKITHSIQAFYNGGDPFIQENIRLIKGSATYSGSATGLYVKEEFISDQNDFEVMESGQFTATAKLEANFGGSEFGADSNYEIKGTITDFNDADGDVIDENWVVTLGEAPFDLYSTSSASYGSTFGGDGNKAYTSTTGVKPSSNNNAGTWSGEFFGNPTELYSVGDGTADAIEEFDLPAIGALDSSKIDDTSGRILDADGNFILIQNAEGLYQFLGVDNVSNPTMYISDNTGGGAVEIDEGAPTGVAGTFSATFEPGGQASGQVEGAFGATRD